MVSLRSIQMYEQRNKDINKASAETLYHIARVLGCTWKTCRRKDHPLKPMKNMVKILFVCHGTTLISHDLLR